MDPTDDDQRAANGRPAEGAPDEATSRGATDATPSPDAPTQVGIPVPAAPAAAPDAPTAAPGGPTSTPVAPRRRSPILLAVVALVLVVALAAAIGYVLGIVLRGPGQVAVAPTPTALQVTPTTTDPGSQPPPATPATPASGSPSDSPQTPGSPGSTTGASPVAGASPDARERLLSHIPPDLRGGCQLEPATEPALAIASCPADDGRILATYFLYGDPDAMGTAYDRFVADSGIDRNSGRCSDPETWPSEGSYSVLRQPRGRVLCMEFSEAPTIYWTDERLNILTWAFHFDGDAERLFEFWQLEAGPGVEGGG